jgi:hypothetical protein
MKALFSPGSIEISSFTTATQALDVDHSFSYFLFPINEISESVATSSCSGAVIVCEVLPDMTPLRTSFFDYSLQAYVCFARALDE